jgi:ribokinase
MSVRTALEVIGFGAMNVDAIALVPKIVVDGETVIRTLRRLPGGSAANTVYGLAKLGLATGFVGAVGTDAEGRMLVEDLAKVGVDTSRLAVKRGVPTGRVWAIADGVSRSLNVYPGANDLLARKDIDLTYLSQAKILHLSSFVNPKQLALQVWLVRRMSPSVRISFAPGSIYARRGAAALRPILERTSVLFVNGEEAGLLTGRRDPLSSAKGLIRLGCHRVAVTLGEGMEVLRVEMRDPRARRGTVRAACYVTDGRTEEVLPPIPARRPVVDSVGAGDAFAAGFLFGVLENRPLRECAQLGQILAMDSLRAAGARAALPNLTALRRAYRRHYGYRA